MKIKYKLSNNISMYFVDSSHVESIGYDFKNKELYIEYKDGSLYKYENVSQDMWNMLGKVNSKGSWVHWYLKINDSTYPYEDVTGEVQIDYVGTAPNPGEPHENGYMAY